MQEMEEANSEKPLSMGSKSVEKYSLREQIQLKLIKMTKNYKRKVTWKEFCILKVLSRKHQLGKSLQKWLRKTVEMCN